MTDAETQPKTAHRRTRRPSRQPAVEPAVVPTAGRTDAQARAPVRGHRLFAIIGLFACLVLAIGILIGRGWVSDQVDGVFASVDDAVARGQTVVAVTTGRLEERVADLDTILADISTVAETATVPAALAERAATIADRFSQIRDGWVAIRARIDAALETLAQVDRALPFVDLPTGPTEELAALDQRIAEIDTDIAGCARAWRRGSPTSKAAATALRGAVDRVADVGTRSRTGWPPSRTASTRPRPRSTRSCGRRRSSCSCSSATSPCSTCSCFASRVADGTLPEDPREGRMDVAVPATVVLLVVARGPRKPVSNRCRSVPPSSRASSAHCTWARSGASSRSTVRCERPGSRRGRPAVR